jgi:hypothetical protein
MNWREQIAEALPPPDNGEPRDLRRDIVDELSDHLACAMSRELRRTEDENRARAAVLNRFGNPAAIARKLWWDAIKETVMKDRLFLVVTLVALVLILAAFVLPWAAQQREINREILAQLQALSERTPVDTAPAAPEAMANWSTAVIKLVESSTDGKSLEDHNVVLRGKAFGGDEIALNQRTDEHGIARFGPIWPGRYTIEVYHGLLRGRGTRSDRGVRYIILYPGGESEEALIVYPGPEFTTDFMPELSPQGRIPDDWLITARFTPVGAVNLDGTTWIGEPISIRMSPRGEMLQPSGGWSSAQAVPSRRQPAQLCARGPFQDALKHARAAAMTYRLDELGVHAPIEDSDPDVVCWRVVSQHGYPPGASPVFTAASGQTNRWTIELPAPLLDAIEAAKAELAEAPATAPE